MERGVEQNDSEQGAEEREIMLNVMLWLYLYGVAFLLLF